MLDAEETKVGIKAAFEKSGLLQITEELIAILAWIRGGNAIHLWGDLGEEKEGRIKEAKDIKEKLSWVILNHLEWLGGNE